MKLKIFLATVVLCSVASIGFALANAPAPAKVANSDCAATCTDGYNNFAKDCLGEKPKDNASPADKLAYKNHAIDCDGLSKNYYKDCLSGCADQK